MKNLDYYSTNPINFPEPPTAPRLKPGHDIEDIDSYKVKYEEHLKKVTARFDKKLDAYMSRLVSSLAEELI